MKYLARVMAIFFVSILFALQVFASNTLELTIPLPLTGQHADFGKIAKRSYMLAAEEINAKGGIKGKKVLLIFEDSEGKPEKSKEIAEYLINFKKQPVLFGEYSSACSKVIAEVANLRKVPYLVVTAADDAITQQNYKYVFRMNPPNSYYLNGLMSFLKQVVKPTTMAILYENSNFGTTGAEAMAKEAEKLGIKVVLKEKYERGTRDFRSLLYQVKYLNPDVIYMVSYLMDATLIMRQIKELQIDAKLFAGGAAGFAVPEFIEHAGDAAEYVVTITLWSPQVKYPGAKEFAKKYYERYKEYPSYHGAEAYSALYIIKNVLERAKNWSPEEIREAMKATNMLTPFGPVKFEDKEGYQNQNFIDTLVLQVINGKHETIWPENYATKKYIYPIPKWKDRR